MSETAIRVQNVTKLYKLYDKPSDRFRESLGLTKKVLHREHYALHDLNFDIKKGECVGIIGTNGSWQTTILKIIIRSSESDKVVMWRSMDVFLHCLSWEPDLIWNTQDLRMCI